MNLGSEMNERQGLEMVLNLMRDLTGSLEKISVIISIGNVMLVFFDD